MSGAHLPTSTSYENRAGFQEARHRENDDLFRLGFQALQQGSAIASASPGIPHLQTTDQAAAELVATMAEAVRNGQLTPKMAALLAGYLDSLTTASECLLVLGISKANRPITKLGQVTSAALAFEDALRRELAQPSALIAAYDAYFAAGPLPKHETARRTYARDLTKKPRSYKRRHKTLAAGTMANTIRPALVVLELLAKAGPGAKKKMPK